MTGLDIRNLAVTLAGTPILRGVSLTVEIGRIVAVLGANGVGKTTLLRSVSGIYRPTSGEVWLDGRNMTAAPAHAYVRAGLAHAPEGRQIFPGMSVRDNLRAGAGGSSARDSRGRLEEMLELFPRLRERAAQPAGSMSGGEQQMLCIARALMSRPRFLLMDEPSLGLAPMVVRQLLELIVRIAAEGVGVLLVEQNARAALGVAHHGHVMKGGRTVLSGNADSLAADDQVKAAYLGGLSKAGEVANE